MIGSARRVLGRATAHTFADRPSWTRTTAHLHTASAGSTPTVAVYAGTFDPPSCGHLDIIRRECGVLVWNLSDEFHGEQVHACLRTLLPCSALSLCDTLHVAVGRNPSKSPMLSADVRLSLLRRMLDAEVPRSRDVHVELFEGLIVDFARQKQANFLVRGLRAYSDFEFEFRMALINRSLSGIETAFLMAHSSHSHVSSTLIREMAKWKQTLPGFVPDSIADEVYTRLGVPYAHAPVGSNGAGQDNP